MVTQLTLVLRAPSIPVSLECNPIVLVEPSEPIRAFPKGIVPTSKPSDVDVDYTGIAVFLSGFSHTEVSPLERVSDANTYASFEGIEPETVYGQLWASHNPRTLELDSASNDIPRLGSPLVNKSETVRCIPLRFKIPTDEPLFSVTIAEPDCSPITFPPADTVSTTAEIYPSSFDSAVCGVIREVSNGTRQVWPNPISETVFGYPIFKQLGNSYLILGGIEAGDASSDFVILNEGTDLIQIVGLYNGVVFGELVIPPPYQTIKPQSFNRTEYGSFEINNSIKGADLTGYLYTGFGFMEVYNWNQVVHLEPASTLLPNRVSSIQVENYNQYVTVNGITQLDLEGHLPYIFSPQHINLLWNSFESTPGTVFGTGMLVRSNKVRIFGIPPFEVIDDTPLTSASLLYDPSVFFDNANPPYMFTYADGGFHPFYFGTNLIGFPTVSYQNRTIFMWPHVTKDGIPDDKPNGSGEEGAGGSDIIVIFETKHIYNPSLHRFEYVEVAVDSYSPGVFGLTDVRNANEPPRPIPSQPGVGNIPPRRSYGWMLVRNVDETEEPPEDVEVGDGDDTSGKSPTTLGNIAPTNAYGKFELGRCCIITKAGGFDSAYVSALTIFDPDRVIRMEGLEGWVNRDLEAAYLKARGPAPNSYYYYEPVWEWQDPFGNWRFTADVHEPLRQMGIPTVGGLKVSPTGIEPPPIPKLKEVRIGNWIFTTGIAPPKLVSIKSKGLTVGNTLKTRMIFQRSITSSSEYGKVALNRNPWEVYVSGFRSSKLGRIEEIT